MKPAKLLGHHVHPMLVVFPLGLLAISLIFDGIYLVTDNPVFARTAYWDILAGVIGGLTAAVFGFWDWLTIPARTRAKRIGAWHGAMNVVVVGLFAVSWLIRHSDALHHAPSTAALVLSGLAVGLMMVSGWLGGELVERLGIGIAPNAGPNAPGSLRSREVKVKVRRRSAAAAMRRRTST
jgi:uncharacterized membrane protein